uniref:Uncharacterized protein n=1 Tax=Leersia perrieri TaxID=77586 RepID=A0A0D9XRZ4_9ORYZ
MQRIDLLISFSSPLIDQVNFLKLCMQLCKVWFACWPAAATTRESTPVRLSRVLLKLGDPKQ